MEKELFAYRITILAIYILSIIGINVKPTHKDLIFFLLGIVTVTTLVTHF